MNALMILIYISHMYQNHTTLVWWESLFWTTISHTGFFTWSVFYHMQNRDFNTTGQICTVLCLWSIKYMVFRVLLHCPQARVWLCTVPVIFTLTNNASFLWQLPPSYLFSNTYGMCFWMSVFITIPFLQSWSPPQPLKYATLVFYTSINLEAVTQPQCDL